MKTKSLVLFAALCMPASSQTEPVLPLSLKRAVAIAAAPEGNTRIQLAREYIRQAESRSAQARAALLPNIDGSVSFQNVTRNLEAYGLGLSIPNLGFSIPTFVGPYGIFDARATLGQNVLDASAIRRFQASKAGIRTAEADSDSAKDQVSSLVAKFYLAALRAEARVEAAKANLNLSETLLKLAQNQKAAGTATGIDETRARVQLANDQQRLLVAENERTQSHLQLLRAMDLRLETKIQLTDKLEFKPAGEANVEKALAVARQSRSDWKAQIQREDGARLNYSATKLERLPSLAGFADYGPIGTGFDNMRPTRTIGFNVKVPIFDGGRRDARRTESLSQFRQEQIKKTDLERQIELEIRLATDNMRSAEEEVKVAEEGLTLSGQEMEQARRRFENGIVSSVEVTEAQTRVERARDNRIAALFLYNQARIDLLQAMGTIRTALD